jgi:hypothetical protein
MCVPVRLTKERSLIRTPYSLQYCTHRQCAVYGPNSQSRIWGVTSDIRHKSDISDKMRSLSKHETTRDNEDVEKVSGHRRHLITYFIRSFLRPAARFVWVSAPRGDPCLSYLYQLILR